MLRSVVSPLLIALLFISFVDHVSAARPPASTPSDRKETPGVSGTHSLRVEATPKTYVSRIIIPRKFLPEGVRASKEPAEDEVGRATQLRSVVAGMALSAAFAGIFIAVRRRRIAPLVVAVVATAVGWWLSENAMANVPAPPNLFYPKIVIEVVDDGDSVVLHLGNTEKKEVYER